MNISSKKISANFVKKILCCFIALMTASFASATNYYVDNTASSGGDGSVESPWNSLKNVCDNSSQFNAGDVIHFKRGQRLYNFYNGTLACSGSSTNPITFTSYGDENEPAPVLSAGRRIDTDAPSKWLYQSNGIYLYTGYTGSAVQFLIKDKFPVKKASDSSLNDGDFFLKPGTGIYIRCASGNYSDYEIYLVNNPIIFNISNQSYLDFDDLTFEFARDAIYGVGDSNAVHNINISNCRFRYVRKGISFHVKNATAENHDITVTDNLFENVRFGFICTAYDDKYRHYNLNISNNTVRDIALNGAFALSDNIPDVEALSFQNLHDSVIANNIIDTGVKSSDNITDTDGDILAASGIIVWLHSDATMENVTIVNNRVSDVEKAIVIGSGPTYKLYNNLIKANILSRNQTGMRLNSNDDTDSTIVQYNEFYDNDISIDIYSGGRGYQILDNRSFWPKLYHVRLWEPGQLTDAFFNYNRYLPDGALWRYEYSNTTYNNLAAWQQLQLDPNSVTTWTGNGLTVKDGLQIWLKSDVGLLNAASEAVNTGDKVQTWLDQSGNNRNYFCTSEARRPVLTTAASPNNSKGVYFDGSNDAMKSDNISITAKSVFIVFKPKSAINAASGAQTIVNNGGELSLGNCTGLLTNELFTVMSKNSSGGSCRSGYTSATDSISGFKIMEIIYNSSNDDYDIYMNGVKVDNAVSGADDNALLAQNVTFHLGSRDLAGGYFNGYIFEYLVYDRSLNNTQSQAVYDYLNRKYVLSHSLPVTSGLKLWLKSDAGLLDAAGNSLTTTGQVQTWQDQSDNNRNFSCTSSGRRPQLEARVSPNAMPGVYFDGVDDAMKLDNVTETAKSIFIAFKTDFPLNAALSPAQTIANFGGELSFGSCTGLLSNEIFTVMSINSSSLNCRSGYTNSSDSMSWFNVLAIVYNSSTKDYDIFCNGIKVDNATVGADDNALAIVNSTIHLGSRDLAGGYFNGYIFEYIIYDNPLNTVDRQAVEDYLSNKYK